ncbi:hypothetical protein, partial [Phascolarctobacterium succinatutens]|uniref:hypothetical protein n=1 Tax=Phascolarctobacterium succinatutens TaxID=626940 RepID=UPI002A7EDB7B
AGQKRQAGNKGGLSQIALDINGQHDPHSKEREIVKRYQRGSYRKIPVFENAHVKQRICDPKLPPHEKDKRKDAGCQRHDYERMEKAIVREACKRQQQAAESA